MKHVAQWLQKACLLQGLQTVRDIPKGFCESLLPLLSNPENYIATSDHGAESTTAITFSTLGHLD